MSPDRDILPPADVWNAARQHSIDNPTHILGPYEGDLGQIHMECVGDGDPYEPNCDFDTAALPVGVSDREDPSVHCATGLIDPDVLALRAALRQIVRECEQDRSRLNPDQARVSIAQAQLRIHQIATKALHDTGPGDTDDQP